MYSKDTIVINLFGGPGAGKSTLAAGIFYELKMRHYNVELVTEAAKEFTYEKRWKTLENQAYVFAKQLQKIHRVHGQADYLITDSPLLLSSIDAPKDYPESFGEFIWDIWNSMANINFYIYRKAEYLNDGRKESSAQAEEIDAEILDYLKGRQIPFTTVDQDPTAIETILNAAEVKLVLERP